MTNPLHLTLACGDYDRTRALMDGTVRPDGIHLICLPLPAEEIFFRMIRFKEFDAAEMSFSSYLINCSRGKKDIIAIPVFPLRLFRHSSVYVHSHSAIKQPRDLIGKRIGVPEYQVTAAVWVRGILQHEYGVSPKRMVWFTGGLEHPGREEKISVSLPSSIKMSHIPPGKTLSQMIETGEIDALIGPRPPSSYRGGKGSVKRLFEDFEPEEIQYYKRNKLFPIMHTVVIRQDIYKSYPWVAQSLYKAFCRAKEICFQHLAETGFVEYSLPWFMSDLKRAKEVLGEDFWPYGVERNQNEIRTLIHYALEQGLIKKMVNMEEVFAKNTLASYKV